MSSRREMLAFISLSRLPSDFQEVEYIENSGTQYIDTGVSVNNKFRTLFSFMYTQNNSDYNRLFGHSQQAPGYGCRSSTNSLTYFYGETNVYLTTNTQIELNRRYLLDFNNNLHFYIDGVDQGVCADDSSLQSNDKIYLFTHSGKNNLPMTISYIKLYFCQIYDSNSILIRDFVPCYRKADGEIGLYDLVNGVFYTNAGTGTFIKGGNV